MRVITSVLLVVSSAFAFQVTFPNQSQGWNTTGPNYLDWQRVVTDPSNFTVVLTNQGIGYNQILDSNIDGTLGSFRCSPPSGGWPSGSNFRVNLAQDAEHTNGLLAQSSEFSITAVSSNQTTTTATSVTGTSSVPSVSSSDTSTTPTGTSAAPLSANAQAGLLTVVSALTVLFATLF